MDMQEKIHWWSNGTDGMTLEGGMDLIDQMASSYVIIGQ